MTGALTAAHGRQSFLASAGQGWCLQKTLTSESRLSEAVVVVGGSDAAAATDVAAVGACVQCLAALLWKLAASMPRNIVFGWTGWVAAPMPRNIVCGWPG